MNDKPTWTPEQQAEHRAQWVSALRSGEYAQAAQVLRDGGAYCCLGVACEISALGEWRNGSTYITATDRNYKVLPLEVMDWLGLEDHDGATLDGDSLTAINDNGATFAEIADLIESGQVLLQGGAA